jgi:hypothetical protein
MKNVFRKKEVETAESSVVESGVGSRIPDLKITPKAEAEEKPEPIQIGITELNILRAIDTLIVAVNQLDDGISAVKDEITDLHATIKKMAE